jgi:tight adherence protein B
VASVLSLVLIAAGVVVACMLVRTARGASVRDRARSLAGPRREPPEWVARRLALALRAADVRIEPRTALQAWATAIVVAVLLGTVFSLALAVLAGVAATVAGPVGLRVARGRGAQRAATAVPDVLERCALELRGGGTVATAIESLAQRDGPLRNDFARVRERCELGASLTDSLAFWPEERPAPGVRAASGALALAASVGGACADALDGLGASLRARLAVAAEARAMSAQARLSAIVVGASPVGYLAWSTLVDPAPLRALVESTPGRICFLAALACEALAVFWMRRVLREEPSWS